MNGVSTRPWRGISQWLHARRKRKELEETLDSLSERQLDDIGIKREDVRTILDGGLPDRTASGAAACPRGFSACPRCGRNGKAA